MDFSGGGCSSDLGALTRDVVKPWRNSRAPGVRVHLIDFTLRYIGDKVRKETRGPPKTLRPALLEPASHPSPQA